MNEMGVQPIGVAGKFSGQHGRLSEPADAVAGRLAGEIGDEGTERGNKTAKSHRAPKSAEDATGFVTEIFRKIGEGGAYFVMDGMTAAVRRMAHGNERELKTGALEPQQLLGDEGFRQSRITLQHYDDPFRHCGRQFVPSISVKRACVR